MLIVSRTASLGAVVLGFALERELLAIDALATTDALTLSATCDYPIGQEIGAPMTGLKAQRP